MAFISSKTALKLTRPYLWNGVDGSDGGHWLYGVSVGDCWRPVVGREEGPETRRRCQGADPGHEVDPDEEWDSDGP